MTDPKERFSNRVDDYVRCRPGYPAALFERLAAHGCLDAGSLVVDVGSGTGILSRGLLAAGGARVVGIEPNAAMRAAAEKALAGHPRFESVDASAEVDGSARRPPTSSLPRRRSTGSIRRRRASSSRASSSLRAW